MAHAEEYLLQYNIKDDEQCLVKFEHIQTLALGILKENPEMLNEELVARLNNLIQESISYNKKLNNYLIIFRKGNYENENSAYIRYTW